LESESCIEQKF